MDLPPRKQKRYLDRILRYETAKPNRILNSFWFRTFAYAVLVFSIVFVKQLFEKGLTELWVLIGSTLLIGCLVGIASMLESSSECWTVVKDYIDFDRIRKERDDTGAI